MVSNSSKFQLNCSLVKSYSIRSPPKLTKDIPIIRVGVLAGKQDTDVEQTVKGSERIMSIFLHLLLVTPKNVFFCRFVKTDKSLLLKSVIIRVQAVLQNLNGYYHPLDDDFSLLTRLSFWKES